MDPRWALPPDEIEVPIPYRLLGLPTPPSEIEVANPPLLAPLPSAATEFADVLVDEAVLVA